MAITTEMVLVTPKLAEKWLGANTRNRPLREGAVERYAADMRAGHWTQCVVPISFYEDGSVADGQHRLWAIVESGASAQFIVLRGVKDEDATNIDRGLIRNVADNLMMSGKFGKDRVVSFNMVAVVKAIDSGTNTRTTGYTQAEVTELLKAYWDVVSWVEAHGPKRKFLRNACMYGAIARALMYEDDRDRMRRFCAIVDEGFAESPTDAAAVALRNMILDNPSSRYAGQEWIDTFNRVQNAIWNFMRGNRITVVKTTEKERYPLKTAPIIGEKIPVKKAQAIISKQRNHGKVLARRQVEEKRAIASKKTAPKGEQLALK